MGAVCWRDAVAPVRRRIVVGARRGASCLLMLWALAGAASAAPEVAGGAPPERDADALPPVGPAFAPVQTGAPRGELTVRPFLRFDEFKWQIAGGTIDIISELDWDDVRTAGLQLQGEMNLGRVTLPGGWLPPIPVSVFGDVAYGHTYRGFLRDSDYALSGKNAEFSRSRSHTDRGRTVDLLVGVQLDLPRIGRVRASPILGISYHQQHFAIRDGVQIVPATGTINGLDSEYRAERYGVMFGGEAAISIGEDLELYTRGIAQYAQYRAEADFNLRNDLGDPSFEQATSGQGFMLRTGVTQALGERWQLELSVEHRFWDADSGRQKFNLASGGASRQRLNEVELRSYTLSAAATYRF